MTAIFTRYGFASFFRRLFSSRGGRFLAFLGAAATIDQVAGRLGIDLFLALGSDPIRLALGGLVLFLALELAAFPASGNSADVSVDQQTEEQRFASAVLDFARYLQATKRLGPLLALRDGVSHFLHLLGDHERRRELGRLGLAAAVQTNSVLHRAQILIDELGWATAAAGKVDEARRNIERGIQLAESPPPGSNPAVLAELGLARAKGLRHLAVLSGDMTTSRRYLDAAENVLSSLANDAALAARLGDAIRRDQAQLRHAEASLLAKQVGVDETNLPRLQHPASVEMAKQAAVHAEEAAGIFLELGDDERNAKALMLLERLQQAQGLEVDAIETAARIRSVLRVSARKNT